MTATFLEEEKLKANQKGKVYMSRPDEAFEIPFPVYLLPRGSKTPQFEKKTVRVDVMRDSSTSVKDRLGVRGLVVHQAQIVNEGEVLKNWFIEGLPIVVLQCASDYEEPDEWAKNANHVARLLYARVNIDCALVALSRSYWQEGYTQFLSSATYLRQVVDSTGGNDFQRRIDFVCLGHPRKELTPVAPFSEIRGTLMLPPILKGDHSGGKIIDEWTDKPRSSVSTEETERVRAVAHRMQEVTPYLERASKAVVRIFGYHAVNHDGPLESLRQRVVSFSGFFVSPIHILTTRTGKYCLETETYAHRFTFSRNTRALHGMLQEGVDMFECTEVTSVIDFLGDSIRNIGVMLEQHKFPEGFSSAPWCDFMLLEVPAPRNYSSDIDYLLPQINVGDIRQGDDLYTIHYTDRPSKEYIDEVFGNDAHCRPDITEEELRRQMWNYDLKVCSVGECLQPVDPTNRVIKHRCSTMQGSRGGVIIQQTHTMFKNDAARKKELGEDSGGLEMACMYAGIVSGRDIDLYQKEQDNIISMSTSELARVESLGLNMYNSSAAVNHVCLTLLYMRYISPAITNPDHRLYLHQYLDPFNVLMSKDLLSQCHRKMLKDADDFNEYGMDFYEHQDLNSALCCFREGARMFSTASIPNLTQYELDLKNALQTNVSAVVVSKLKDKQQ